jgi:hypothetical protein
VRPYVTFGGTVGSCSRYTRPSSSIRRRRALRTFGEIPSIRRCSWPKRVGPSESV